MRRNLSKSLLRSYTQQIIVEFIESEDEIAQINRMIEIGIKDVSDAIKEVVSGVFNDPETLKFLMNLYDEKSYELRLNILHFIEEFDELNEGLFKEVSREKQWTTTAISSLLNNKLKKKKEYLENYGYLDVAHATEIIKSVTGRLARMLRSAPKAIQTAKDQAKLYFDFDKIDTAAEAPEGAPLGRIAFAPSRNDVPHEENTKEEDILLKKLVNYFFKKKSLDKKSYDSIKKFMKNGWYSPVFKEPDVDVIYKRIPVTKDWLEEFVGGEVAGDTGSLKVSNSLGTEEKIEKWSKEKSEADKFGPYSVVLSARVADNPNKMLDCEKLRKISNIIHVYESDVICFGPIKVYNVEWTTNQKDVDDTLEAPKNAPLGQIAFAPSRKNKPYEENTKEEEKLLTKIHDHFDGQFDGGKPLDKKSFDRIKEFIKNGWYSPVFKEASGGTIYRGFSVNKAWMKKVVGDSFKDFGSKKIIAKIGKEGKISSWSKDKSVSTNFSLKHISPDREYAIIIHAMVEDNPDVTIDCEGLYQISAIEQFEDELEVVCSGPVKIYKIEWKKFSS